MRKLIYSLSVCIISILILTVFVEASAKSLLISNLESEQVTLSLDDGYVVIKNLPENEQFEYLTAIFYKGSGYKSKKSASNLTTRTVKFEIPYYSDGDYEVAIFCGNDILTPFLPYTITIRIDSGKVSLVDSPTLASNKKMFESAPSSKNDMEYYSFYYLSQEDGDEQLRNVVKGLISGLEKDYDKAFAIYDWLSSNFYYKPLSKDNQNFSNSTMKDLLIDKICDSKDFASLYSYMLRAAGIPTRSVYGIGLVNNRDASQSTIHHYWNEVYVDGKWIIVDVAMSCANQYLDGSKIRVPKTNNIYFDSTLEFFSYSHSIISYETPAYYEGYNSVDVSDKPNGTKKTLDALGLPKNITARTSIGEIQLNVEWNLSKAKYDPSIKTKQTFTVEGTFTLPSIFAACNSLTHEVTVEITVNARYPVSLEIDSLPNKLVYFRNDDLETNGLILKATFDNGDVEPVKYSYEVEYDFSKTGKSTVVCIYKELTVDFEVDVVSKTPSELKVEKGPNKSVYFLNEEFDSTGIKLLAMCEKGLSYYVEDYDIEYDFSVSGIQNVVLTYSDISVIITVQVDAVVPVEMKLFNLPSNREFQKGTTPDFSRIYAEITFNDGSKKNIMDELLFSYDFSSVGDSFVNVSYGDLTSSFAITVIDVSGENSDTDNESSSTSIDVSSSDSSKIEINNGGNKNTKLVVIEIFGISFVCILLVVLSFFALKRANEIRKISDWLNK